MARDTIPILSEREAETLRKLLKCSDEKDFQVEPVRGPLPNNPKKSGRWIVRVRIGAAPADGRRPLFEVIVRDDSKGYFFLDTGDRGQQARPYCGTKDVNEAIALAERFLEGKRASAGADGRTLQTITSSEQGATVGDLQTLFPSLDASQVRTATKYRTAIAVAVAVFGADKPISKIGPNGLEAAIHRRQAGISALGFGPVKLTTAVGTFKDFVTVARQLNKLSDDETSVPQCHLRSTDLTWPKAPKERRTAAKKEGFEVLMLPFTYVDDQGLQVTLPAPVDAVDPSGRLRMFLAFVYYFGRRFSAILNLLWDDIVTDVWDVRSLLDKADISTRDWVPHYPNGAANFRREFDKENNHFVPPIPDALDREITLFAQRCGGRTGPMFPGDRLPLQPLAENMIRCTPNRKRNSADTGWQGRYVKVGLYEQAVMLAARYLALRGDDPGAFLHVEPLKREDDKYDLLDLDAERFHWRILPGHKLHRWRATFATKMHNKGWGQTREEDGKHKAAVHAAPSFIGSWVPHDGTVQSDLYANLNPALIWYCASGLSAQNAMALADAEEQQHDTGMDERLEAYTQSLLTELLTE